jgi:ankyrin repeat protein
LQAKNAQGKAPVDLTNSEYLRWETEEDIEEIGKEEEDRNLRAETKKSGKGALAKATKKKDLDKVLKLLRGGADPNEANEKGSVPLMDAVWNRSVDIADALISQKADVNHQNFRGNTALHFAFERNSKLMVTLLIEHGATPSLKTKNCMGKKPAQLTTKQYLRRSAALLVSDMRKLVKRVSRETPSPNIRHKAKTTS